MAKGADSQVVSIAGHRLRITNLDKVLYPETGTTKAEVIGYYASIAPAMLPHTMFRPATRKRWVHGVGTPDSPGTAFFQKDLGSGTPDWVPRVELPHSDRTNTYPLVNDAAVLAWLGQIAALEIHVPQWRFTHDGVRRNPDRLVLDLDPGEGIGLAECAEVARFARRILLGMGLDPMPVTSGSKGIHLYAQLDERQTSDQVSAVAHELARVLEADHPDLVVSDMTKALRTGKVLVDWSQNNGSKTTIAPYSLRGRFRPTVAAPRTWAELESPDLAHLEFAEVISRVEEDGDLLAAIDSGVGPAAPSAALASESAAADRLTEYRAKRDASKTPEPVPDAVAAHRSGTAFVIQEHHARRLHYDLRLERDGVLVSWALPKGVPTDPGRNHLAVQTEDHPLEYAAFEGTIPRGEYGAGTMRIWDSGSYELEKWRDDEVIVTLIGSRSGALGEPVRIALIRTGVDSSGKASWLIHRMKSLTPHHSPAQRRRYDPVPPRRHEAMLAKAGTLADIDDRAQWAIEMKWDGIRAIASVEDDVVRLMTRRNNDVTDQYPELAALAQVAHVRSGVFDGEIVATDATGRPDFGLLQERMNLTRPAEIAAAMARRPVRLLLFDVLELDGDDLTRLDYTTRRSRLERAVDAPRGSSIAVPDAFDADASTAIEASRELGLEGVLAKEHSSRYEEGRRSGAWIKIKHLSTQEVVIGGWRPGRGHRSGTFGSLLMGVPTPKGLAYVGRVGTGFRDRDLDAIAAMLAPIARASSPFIAVPAEDAADAHWIDPVVVGEVEYAERTRTGSLRHPSWRGLRPDKRPEDVHPE